MVKDPRGLSQASELLSLSQSSKRAFLLDKVQLTADRNVTFSTAQNEKQNRILRDLQFELANNSIVNLRAIKSNISDRADQIDEIAAFESRLPRDQFGGCDEAAAPISISYENGKAFLIESDARKQCHFDSDTSTFVTKLKARVKDKRNVSLDKDRRKKKAIANQTTSSSHSNLSVNITTERCGQDDHDDWSDDDSRNDPHQVVDDRKAEADKSMQKFAEQIRMQHAEGDHIEKLSNVINAQKRRSSEKKARNYKFCNHIVQNLISSIEHFGCQISESQGTKTSSRASEELLDVIDMQLESAKGEGPYPSATRWSENSSHECSVPFYLISSNTARWDFIPKIRYDRQNAEARCSHGQDVAPLMDKVPRYLESSLSTLEALLEIRSNSENRSNSISLALDLKEQCDLNKNTVILVLRGGPSACLAPADILRTVHWMGGSAMVEVWDVAAAVEVGRTLAHLMEGKTSRISVPALIEIFLRGGVFAETSMDVSQVYDSLTSITVEPIAMKVAVEIADAAIRILNSSNQTSLLANSTTKADLKARAVTNVVSFTDITFGILLGQVLWLRNYVKSLHTEHYVATARLESTDTFTPPSLQSSQSPLFPPIVLACSCIDPLAALAERDSASFALVVDWFLRGGSRESLHDSIADSAWKRLLKDAVATEGDIALMSHKNRKEKGSHKVKNGLNEVEAKGHGAISCIFRVVKSPHAQINLVDASDLGLDKVPALRHESLRLVVSSYYTASRESKSDRNLAEDEAQELIIEQSAASLGIQHLQLLLSGHLSERAPLISHLVNENTLVCSAGLSVSETLLAVALTCGNINRENTMQAFSVMSAALGPTEADFNMRRSVAASIVERRKRLTEAEQLWLCHTSDVNPIDFVAVYNALNLISNSIAFDTEMTGTVLMAFGRYVSLFEKEFISRETVIKSSIKAPDSRFKIVCSQLLVHLSSINSDNSNRSRGLPATRVEAYRLSDDLSLPISDCLCLLGDVIDDRHMTWISLAAVQRAALEQHMQNFIITTSRISSQLAAVMSSAHAMKGQSASSFANLFSSLECTAGSSAPPRSGFQAPRRAIKMSRDRLAEKSRLLADLYSSCGRCSGSSFSTEETDRRESKMLDCMDFVDPWSDGIFLDQPTTSASCCDTDMSLEEGVQSELYAELLERATSLLSGLIVVLTSLQAQLKNHHESMQNMIVGRYRYEHSLLAEWATAFKASMVASNGYLTIPTPSYYFDVINPVDKCSLPSTTVAATEVGDLVLSLHGLHELSKLMTSDAETLGAILTDESCHSLLLKAVNEMKEEHMSSAWRVARLTEPLVRGVIKSCNEGKAPYDCMVGSAFVKSLVMTIFIASVSEPPQQDFILHLGSLLSTSSKQKALFFTFLPQNRPSIASFRRLLLADTTLLAIWCSTVALCKNTAQALNDMVDALLAVATCCLDADGRLIEEQVLLLLCYSPPSMRTRSFERALLMRVDVGSDLDHLPPLLMEGLCKALALTSKIGDILTSPGSGGIESKISSIQYQMLLQDTSHNLPAALPRSRSSDTAVLHLVSNGQKDFGKKMDKVDTPNDGDLLQRCHTQADNPDISETAVMLCATQESMTTDVQVAQDVLDTIMKSGRTTIPFCVSIIL